METPEEFNDPIAKEKANIVTSYRRSSPNAPTQRTDTRRRLQHPMCVVSEVLDFPLRVSRAPDLVHTALS